MKLNMFSKETVSTALHDRTLIILTAASTLIALTIILSVVVQVRPSDVQVPIRYTAFGEAILYTDQWYYLLSFLGAGLVILAQPLITLKLLQERGREFAIGFASVTNVVATLGLLLTLAVLRTASISL